MDIIYFAGVEFDDISNKIIIDLGAGTGRLSIASVFLGAKCILSVDIDIEALLILKKNIQNLGIMSSIFPICANIKNFHLREPFLLSRNSITTIMNPPFGVQTKAADREFLKTAFSFSHIIYSIHLSNEGVQRFISRFIKKFDWKVDYVFPYQLILEKTFDFHQKKKKLVEVDIYRFSKKEAINNS